MSQQQTSPPGRSNLNLPALGLLEAARSATDLVSDVDGSPGDARCVNDALDVLEALQTRVDQRQRES